MKEVDVIADKDKKATRVEKAAARAEKKARKKKEKEKKKKEKRKATARANAVERDFCARTDMERVAGILYFLFRKYIPLCTARLSQRLVSYTHDR